MTRRDGSGWRSSSLLLGCFSVLASFAFAPGCAHRGDEREHARAHEDGAHHGGHSGHSMPHRFEDADRWAKEFEDPSRDAWQKPDEVIAALKIPHGAKVADIGAATGYFPVRIARARPDVTVYGVDIEPDMVRYLGERAQREGLSNVQPVLGAADDPKLPEPVRLVLIVDTYHHLGERPAYFQRLIERSLTDDGRIAIIDFTAESPMGPPPEHRLSAEAVIAELAQAGLRLSERHDFLPHQYFLVFERAPAE